jgi:hypothetical protein
MLEANIKINIKDLVHAFAGSCKWLRNDPVVGLENVVMYLEI